MSNLDLYKDIMEKVYNYPTKHVQGFSDEELKVLYAEVEKSYPDIVKEKFNDALRGITCMVVDGDSCVYHEDILKALMCGLENRRMRSWEWD